MDKTAAVSDIILQSERIVVFTGAGISTESGISDFRSPGGIWDRFDPNELTYQKFLSSPASREKYWDFSKSLWPTMADAKPNRGHNAVAELHRMGRSRPPADTDPFSPASDVFDTASCFSRIAAQGNL